MTSEWEIFLQLHTPTHKVQVFVANAKSSSFASIISNCFHRTNFYPVSPTCCGRVHSLGTDLSCRVQSEEKQTYGRELNRVIRSLNKFIGSNHQALLVLKSLHADFQWLTLTKISRSGDFRTVGGAAAVIQ